MKQKLNLHSLIDLISKNPKSGTYLGNNCYKVRMAISSKGKGKSGGARVITFVKVVNEVVYLASIYDKSEKSDISVEELNSLFGEIEE